MNYSTLAVRVILVFAILWRSSLALPNPGGVRSPLAGREIAERENCTRGLPENKSRILLVPGLMGSRLHAKVTLNHIFCSPSEPKLFWIDLRHISCIKYLKLDYNEYTNTYSNRTGAEMTVPDFGGTSAVECLSEFCLTIVKYLKEMVDYFVARGYKRGVDIRAAPYDWRLAAGTARRLGYFTKLKSLIEDMYNGVGVTMVAHSMGGLMSLYFLNEVVTQEWKNKYIKAYVPIAVPYGGAVPALAALLSGSAEFADFEIPSFLRRYVADFSRSFESAYWLLPNPKVFNDCVIVETPSNSRYTAKHYREIFTYKNLLTEWSKYQGVLKTTVMNLGNPNVPTYCLYGTGVPTTEKLVYSVRRRWFIITYTHLEEVEGDGDGKVNRKSLDVCTRWTDNVCTWHGSNSDHMGILKSRLTFKTIESIINCRFTCVR